MFPETFNFNDLALCHLCVSGIGALQPCGIVPTNMERSPTDPRRMALHVGHSVPFVAGTLETMSRSGLFNSLYSRLCAATMWVNAMSMRLHPDRRATKARSCRARAPAVFRHRLPGMCNLYAMTRNRDAIKRLFRIEFDRTAKQPTLPAIFPDQLASRLPRWTAA